MRTGNLFALMTACSALGALAEAALASESSARQFFTSHCVECHGADTQESSLRLDSLSADFAAPASFALWVKIHDRLADGSMPPKDNPQPTAEERQAVVEWLDGQLTQADLARRKAEGRTVLRRLNRTEYENTLRDLLEMPGLRVRELLPEDGRAHGYDKSGDGLELSHVQMAKYMEAAEAACDLAKASQIARPEVFRERLYLSNSALRPVVGSGDAVFLKDFKVDQSIIPIPGDFDRSTKEGNLLKNVDKSVLDNYEVTVGFFRHEDEAFRPTFSGFDAVYPGMYRLRISLWSFQWDQGEVLPASKTHALSLAAVAQQQGGRTLGYFDAPSLRPTEHEIVVWLNPGEKIGFNAASLRPVRVSERTKRAAGWVGPGIAIDWLDIEGPLLDRWPAESHRRLFGDLALDVMDKDSPLRRPVHPKPRSASRKVKLKPGKPVVWTVASTDPKADAERLLSAFLPRAFRGPVPAEDVAEYVAMVEQRLGEKLTFEDAMGWTYKTALCSPEFLFLAQPPGPLDDWALASRLSYFLWNSMPDDTLLSLAAEGKLRNSQALREQVERMLSDAKAQRFIDDFVDQWLGLQDIDMTTPDKKLYPEFGPYLRDSMLGETRAFFRELLDHDRDALNFADSDFAMLNQRMAEHYGIAGVEGAGFRSVALPPGCHRGGVMTQASVLKITANGTTTTPVKRGAWVLREILGQPPAPPPPNVPAIEPDVSGATTIREQLDKHRSSQVCASCHAQMDAPGFALESFDVIGGWRTQYRALIDGEPMKSPEGFKIFHQPGPAVDSAGKLKDGRTFADIDEFRRLLRTDPDRIARNVVEQLLKYATGAEISFADRKAVDDILRRAGPGRGLRSMVHEVVQSRLFLEK